MKTDTPLRHVQMPLMMMMMMMMIESLYYYSPYTWLYTVGVFFCQEGDNPDDKKFDGGGMDKDLVEALERDILQRNPNVHW